MRSRAYRPKRNPRTKIIISSKYRLVGPLTLAAGVGALKVWRARGQNWLRTDRSWDAAWLPIPELCDLGRRDANWG